jgi:hypothetical protein
VEWYLEGKTRDPWNLIHDCHRHGIKSPLQITIDKLKTKFFVCKRNIELPMKNSPFFRLKFLKDLVKSAKERGDKLRESKVTGII